MSSFCVRRTIGETVIIIIPALAHHKPPFPPFVLFQPNTYKIMCSCILQHIIHYENTCKTKLVYTSHQYICFCKCVEGVVWLLISPNHPKYLQTNTQASIFLLFTCWKMLYKIKQCRYALWDLRKSWNNNQTPKPQCQNHNGKSVNRVWCRRSNLCVCANAQHLPLGSKFLILISKKYSF